MDKNQKDVDMILNKSRDIIMTSYNNKQSLVSAVENRMYNYILYKAQKQNKTDKVSTCTITREEIIKYIVKKTCDQSRESIDEFLDNLQATKLVFWKQVNNEDIKVDTNLIAVKEYNLQKDLWEITISEVIYDYLTNYHKVSSKCTEDSSLQGNTTSTICYAPINLNITNTFKSFYTQQLYEMIRLWSRHNKEIEHKFSLEELRFVLGVGDKYPRFTNFNQMVLNVCKKELEEKAKMELEFKPLRTGRTISHIIIKVKDKEPKRYFRNVKIDELKNIDMSMLDEFVRVLLQNELYELEYNSQLYDQKSFEYKVKDLKQRMLEEIMKTKEIEKYFDKVTLDRFRVEYATFNFADEKIKVQIIEAVNKTLSNTKNNGLIFIKNYEYFKTVFNQLDIKNNNFEKPEEVQDVDFEEISKEVNKEIPENNSNVEDVITSNNTNKVENQEDKIIENDDYIKHSEDIEIMMEKLKGYVQNILSDDVKYKCWLKDGIENGKIENNVFKFIYKDGFTKNIIEDRFIDVLKEAIRLCELDDIILESL